MKSIFAALAVFLVFGCQVAKEEKKIEEKPHQHIQKTEQHQKHWSYSGETNPEHWVEVEKNSDCGGKYQSPINIVNYAIDSNLKPLEINYSKSILLHDVANNGHSIQYNFNDGDYIVLENEKYHLKQFHFHEPAEHTIDGIRYPMVLHLVHVNDAGKYAVLAVMVKEGKGSAPFHFLESYLPLSVGETKTVDKVFDMNLNLPKKKSYFTYMGSLTTPPCTERVKWFIFKDPITISLSQVLVLQKLMPHNNYRNEQPLNDRVIKLSN